MAPSSSSNARRRGDPRGSSSRPALAPARRPGSSDRPIPGSPLAREPGADRQAPAREREARAGGLVFTNRVWVVEASSSVAVGSVYVFLGDRTLVLTSPGGTPAFGRWVFERGELAIEEDGLAYPVDILQARGDHLRLRIHGPGDPVTLELRDARPDWIGEESRR